MLKWDHWHIEVSSICTLKCPRCPRAELPDTLLNKSLNLDFFQTQLGVSVISKIKKITFCGNDGDPIYCKDFLEILSWLKTCNPNLAIVIITNGSHKTPDWWRKLALILDHKDELHFSLDGLEHNNHVYRVNSNWSSIQQGIEVFRAHNAVTYMIWATIAFSFNENQLAAIQQYATDMKFDAFQLTLSTKFGSVYPQAYGHNDWLEPTNSSLISLNHRFQRQFIALTQRPRPDQNLKQIFLQRAAELNQHSGICLIGNKGVFLNSQGEFYPCCWTANRYPHNQSWQGRFNLYSKTFDQIITDPFWTTEFLNFSSYECKTKCTAERLTDQSHISEW